MADGIRVAPSSEPSIPADPWKAAFAEWWHSSGFRKSFSVEEVFKAGWDAAPIERIGRAPDENYVPADESILFGLTQLWIEHGVRYYGWL